jgi:DNA-binding IclR family transcriptional regulator
MTRRIQVDMRPDGPLIEMDAPYQSPPVERAAKLLRFIADGGAVDNISAAARVLKINRTTLLRLLATLEAERFIERRPGGGWRIGLGLIGLAADAFFSEDLVQLAVPYVTKLADLLGLSAHLGVLDGTDVIYVVRRTPNHSYVSNIRVGSRLPAHASVMGRIMLAQLTPERVRRLYEGVKLTAVTPHTPVTLQQLFLQLNEDSIEGLAWSEGYYEAGISSVAAAVLDATNAPVAALNVSGPKGAFDAPGRRELVGQTMRDAAEELSRWMGWVGKEKSYVPKMDQVA